MELIKDLNPSIPMQADFAVMSDLESVTIAVMNNTYRPDPVFFFQRLYNSAVRPLTPIEGPGNGAAVGFADMDCVVGFRAAKIVSPGSTRVIEARSGINKDRLVIDMQPYGQRVGVSVGGDAEMS